jgi:hypothetical protein
MHWLACLYSPKLLSEPLVRHDTVRDNSNMLFELGPCWLAKAAVHCLLMTE